MVKGMKKAIGFVMAVSLLIGSGLSPDAIPKATITPEVIVQEGKPEEPAEQTIQEEQQEPVQSAETGKTNETKSLLDVVGTSFAKISDLWNALPIVANAAPDTSEWRYVLEVTGNIIEKNQTATMETNEVTVYLNRINIKGEADMGVVKSVVFSSDKPDVISIAQSGTSAVLTAKKPGWAMIRADITQDDGTVESFSAAFLVRAELDRRTDPQWKNVGSTTEKRILVLDPTDTTLLQMTDDAGNIKKGYQLKFINLPPAENKDCVKFNDPVDQGIVSIDDNGILTIDGSGYTKIKIQNYANVSISGGGDSGTDVVVEEYEIEIVVLPTGAYKTQKPDDFSKTVDVRITTEELKAKYKEEGATNAEFILHTNALPASRLIWDVYAVKQNGTKGRLIAQTGDPLLSYTYEGSNVKFTNVKAGTYIVEARATKAFTEASEEDLPCLTFKVIVELLMPSDTVKYMNVGDMYNINENSNIPEGMFGKLFAVIPDPTTETVASMARATGVVTAHVYGQQKFKISYQKSADFGIYVLEEANKIQPVEYTFEVIDTLSLNSSSLVMFTGGTYQLKPNQTQPGPVFFECSEADKQYIEVSDNGLITAKKETPRNYEATVTAYQIIDGVRKTATCKITVQQTVSQIILTPSETTIGIGETKEINALITPTGLVDVHLSWQSSDPTIFSIADNGATSAQITGLKGGTAILTAINDKNVVVGYCTVTVKQQVQQLTLSEVEVRGKMKQTHQLYATITPENATNQTLKWTSSNNSIVSVDKTGKLTFNKAGTAVITVQSEDNPALMAQCTVTVLQSVADVELDEELVELYVGESKRLTYMVYPSTASSQDVQWTSFDTSVVTVDDEGLLSGKRPGTTQVMVMTYEGSYYAICTVVVKQRATGVRMNATELTMNAGEYYDMDVTITPATATDANLIWESLNTKVVTVSSTGRITARGVGTAIILVKTEGGATSYCTVTVLEAVRSMELDPSELTIDVGEAFTIAPVFSPSSASNTQVKWESSDTSVATVSAAGTVTGVERGTTVITCTSMDGGYKAFCLVTVEDPLMELRIEPDNYRLGFGKTFTLRAVIVKNGEVIGDAEVEWYSSDDSICSVDKSGKITGEDYGYATITAEALDGTGRRAECEVRVVREVTSIKLNHNSLTIIQGESAALVATVQPSNATYKTVLYSSDDESIAMVDDDGVITGLKPGTTMVYAKARDNSGKYATCYVTVIAPIASTGVSVSDTEVVLMPGETKAINISMRPNNSTDKVTWSSSNEAIATVSGSGIITAVSTGTTSVTVMTASGRTARVSVIVLGLSRETLEIPVYTQYSRLVVDGATANVRWDVEDTSICEVSNGVITARKVGTTYVTATVNGRTLRCRVKVVK